MRYSNDFKKIASARLVTPAKAGVQPLLKSLDSGFRRNDGKDFRIKAKKLKLTPLASATPMRPSGRSSKAPLRG